ncbi:TlpA family protein disulfide reductase [Paenibacillus endoradicis]|uniref:TlpA family protein disulfide reductase n=1 Tax=Paenibacillus endoradicis TaxID=2972487 RepID=UPI002158C25E|nr:redoxin domain-containing protein [Paenibacillus endoradicis]MCR8659573.1 redoxin domain-containing protein [Paenibacillus endoradicis]
MNRNSRKAMQWSIIVVGILIIIYLVVGSRHNDVSILKVGDTLPAIELSNMNNEKIALAEFTGKPMLINLWASWCTPCINELPLLNEVQQFAPEVEVVAINMGETTLEIEPFQTRYDLTMPILLDPQLQMKQLFKVSGYPVSIMITDKGTIQSIVQGEITDFNKLLDDLQHLSES